MPLGNTVIQIKYSTANGRPATLNVGELGYSFVSNTFFIGTTSNTTLNIGGHTVTTAVENRTSANTSNTLVQRDANGSFSATRDGASRQCPPKLRNAYAMQRGISCVGMLVLSTPKEGVPESRD